MHKQRCRQRGQWKEAMSRQSRQERQTNRHKILAPTRGVQDGRAGRRCSSPQRKAAAQHGMVRSQKGCASGGTSWVNASKKRVTYQAVRYPQKKSPRCLHSLQNATMNSESGWGLAPPKTTLLPHPPFIPFAASNVKTKHQHPHRSPTNREWQTITTLTATDLHHAAAKCTTRNWPVP